MSHATQKKRPPKSTPTPTAIPPPIQRCRQRPTRPPTRPPIQPSTRARAFGGMDPVLKWREEEPTCLAPVGVRRQYRRRQLSLDRHVAVWRRAYLPRRGARNVTRQGTPSATWRCYSRGHVRKTGVRCVAKRVSWHSGGEREAPKMLVRSGSHLGHRRFLMSPPGGRRWRGVVAGGDV